MHDTLTLMRLGITGKLAKTLCSTNPCESMIEIVRYTQRNVKRWHGVTPASPRPAASRSASRLPSDRQPSGSPTNFHDDPDNLTCATTAADLSQRPSRASTHPSVAGTGPELLRRSGPGVLRSVWG